MPRFEDQNFRGEIVKAFLVLIFKKYYIFRFDRLLILFSGNESEEFS